MTYSATNRGKRKPIFCLRLTSAICFTLALVVLYLSPYELWVEQNTGLTALFNLRGETAAPTDIVIVSLNSAAAERLGLSRHSITWPRTLYADLINQLSKTSAELIVLDVAFNVEKPEEDNLLEQALAKNPNVILFKYLKRRQIPSLNGFTDVEEEVPSLPRFTHHALASGFFVLPKTNGKLFEAPLFLDLPTGPQASQPFLAYLAKLPLTHQNSLWQAVTDQPMDTQMPLSERATTLITLANRFDQKYIPHQAMPLYQLLTQNRPLTINFYGGANTLNHIDIDRVLEMDSKSLAQWFDQKVVYVGYMEGWQTEQQDAYTTVYTSGSGIDISGVEISATVLANLRHKHFILPTQPILRFIFSLLVFAFVFTLFSLPGKWNAVIQITFACCYCTVAYLLFTHYYLWLPLAIPMIAAIMANITQLSHFYRHNQKRLRNLRYTLEQYLPHEAANHLSNNILELERHHQIVSGVVLMTDIKGYTRLSETLPPGELHELMNRYYKQLITLVKDHQGVVANLVGDSLLAMWTGSSVDINLCNSALQCAQRIQQSIKDDLELSQRLPTCIALHGGQFSLGNLGAEGHFEYSPVGDIINTTSRIEHFNRDLDTQILLSQTVADQLLQSSQYRNNLRYLGAFNMRNRSAAVSLYTASLPTDQLDNQFRAALQCFQLDRYSEAEELFNKILQQAEDGPSRYYRELCQQRNPQ